MVSQTGTTFATIAGMRALLFAALLGCSPRVPEPQPPRTVCNGVLVPAGAAVALSSTCYDLPADPCFDDDSEECQDEARRRDEANRDARTRDRVGIILLASTAIVLVGALIIAH